MAPAILTDVDWTETRCDFARSDEMNVHQFIITQLLLSTILPFILPFICLAAPLYKLTRFKMESNLEHPTASLLKNVLGLGWSYVLLW